MIESDINENERREYYRVYDAISLEIEPLNKKALRVAIEHFGEARHRYIAQSSGEPDKNRIDALLGRLQRDYPELVAYLMDLESRLAVLGEAAGATLSKPESTPTHKVNICGNGISFGSDQPVMAGELMLLKMQLFPSQSRIMVIAEAVNSQEIDGKSVSGAFATGAKFVHIDEQDRETLLKHIHELQMKSLQGRRNYTSAA